MSNQQESMVNRQKPVEEVVARIIQKANGIDDLIFFLKKNEKRIDETNLSEIYKKHLEIIILELKKAIDKYSKEEKEEAIKRITKESEQMRYLLSTYYAK